MDKKAAEEFPMLLDHPTGIKAESVFTSLLAPKSSDIEYLSTMRAYIEHRNANAHENAKSLIDHSCGPHSFSVKHARVNAQMQKVKAEILNRDELKKRAHDAELEKLKKEHALLMEKHKSTSCKYSKASGTNRVQHSASCERCKLEKSANLMKLSVFESALPDDEHQQDAVVFELRIPQSIACLRDALHLLNTKVFGFRMYANHISYIWSDHKPLAEYVSSPLLPTHVTLCCMPPLDEQHAQLFYHPTLSRGKFFPRNSCTVALSDFRFKLEYKENSTLKDRYE